MAFQLKVNRNVRKGQEYVPALVHVSSPTAVPAGSTVSKFTIVTGRILVHRLVGEVTTLMETAACNVSVVINPTTGTSGTVASTLDVTADEVGTLYKVEGDSTALVGTDAGTGWLAAGLPAPFIVPVGTIDVVTSATVTGSIKWDLWYEPLDEGAYVTVP